MSFKPLNILRIILLPVNLLAVVVLLFSAVSGIIDPHVWKWCVSLSLCFPVFVAVNVAFILVWLILQSRHWLWSALALAACAYQLFTYCPINLPQSAPAGSIKVVSYNSYGFGYGDKDSTCYLQMLDYLRNSDANILCVQEGGSLPIHQKSLVEATAHWPYKDTVQVDAVHNSVIIFSDYPLLSRHITYSSSPGHLCAIYKLDIEGDTICVVNSHFVSNSISSNDKQAYHKLVTVTDEDSSKQDILRLARKINEAGLKRAEQADSLAMYLETLGDMPVIVCGDFNDSPLSYAHHRLVRILDDAYTASGLGPGISYHKSQMFFRLDNILCSHHWKSYGADVDAKAKMSDHYPISVWLKKTE